MLQARKSPVRFTYSDANAEKVHLWMNRVTDKANTVLGWMQRVPGTTEWELMLELEPELRASYGFIPLKSGEELHQGPWPEGKYLTFLDQKKAAPILKTDGQGRGLNIYEGPAAPEQKHWSQAEAPASCGRVETFCRSLTGGKEQSEECQGAETAIRPIKIYLPNTSTMAICELPLVVLFDGEEWFGDMDLPKVLDQAIADGTIPPVAVVGICNTDRADRMGLLGVRKPTLDAIVHEFLPWLSSWLLDNGVRLQPAGQWMVAGQSLGGIAALTAATLYPEVFKKASVSSPSVWWSPDSNASPRDLSNSSDSAVPRQSWITEFLYENGRPGSSTHVSIGAHEGPLVAKSLELVSALQEAGHSISLSKYCGGHDLACWRGELFNDICRYLENN